MPQLVSRREADGVLERAVDQARVDELSFRRAAGELNPLFFSGGDRNLRHLQRLHVHAVRHVDALHGSKVLGVLERLLVAQQHGVMLGIVFHGAQRADDVLVFDQAGVRRAVWVDQTVHAEVTVVHDLVKVAAVEIHLLAGLGAAHVNGMIAPFPDKAAAEILVFIDQFLIILCVSGAVAHGMDVLTEDQRLIVLGIFAIFADEVQLWIHPAVQVDVLISLGIADAVGAAFIVQQTRGLVFLDPLGRLDEVLTVARFVAHRPDQHARAVLVTNNAALHTVEHGLFIHRIFCQQRKIALVVFAEAVHHAVHLDIALINDIQAELIAQLVEIRAVGVVAGAHGVDIVLFHQAQVAQHLVIGHGKAVHGRAVVAVRTAELDGLSVELDDAVFDGHLAHAHGGGEFFHLSFQRQVIKVRRLGVPELGRVEHKTDLVFYGLAGHYDAAAVLQRIFHIHRRGGVQIDFDMRLAARQLGADGEIAHAGARTL